MPAEGVLIDTEGLDKFLDPDTKPLKKYWDRFGLDVVHFIPSVGYWEFLNGWNEFSHQRRRINKLIEDGVLQVLPFGRDEAIRASEIYRRLRPLIERVRKKKKRERLEPLQSDVFIAATAHCHRKRVFTMDPQDWPVIQRAIQEFSVNALDVDFGKEL